MVIKIKDLFQCEECKLKFKNIETAKKCEIFCEKYKSCNTEFIKEAVS
jgi:hypothetical protein